jgi:hypothetical protein
MNFFIFSLERVISLLPLPLVVVSICGYIAGPFLLKSLPSVLARAAVYGLIGGGVTFWDYATYRRTAEEYEQAPLWVLIGFSIVCVVFWSALSYAFIKVRQKKVETDGQV